jgi:hypothetical protein
MICIAVRAGLAAGAAIVFGFTQISCANISPTTDVTAIRVDGDEIVQTFGTIGAKPPLPPPDTAAGAYMFYKGRMLGLDKLSSASAGPASPLIKP